MAEQCAWASLNVSGVGWLNASVGLSEDGRGLLLRARLPPARGRVAAAPAAAARVVGSRYGWGPIPMLTAYDVHRGGVKSDV